MIIDWLITKRWLKYREQNVLGTFWFQKQLLKKRYQGKNLDKKYKKKEKYV
jgi:hypothetical protein